MAENQSPAQTVQDPGPGAVLRPGRAADPAPIQTPVATPSGSGSPATAPQQGPEAQAAALATATVPLADTAADQAPAVAADEGTGEKSDENPADDSEQGAAADADTAEQKPPVPDQVQAEARQRQLRLMLSQCDRVLLMDFERLAMADWPDDFTLATAKRNRDLWLFSAVAAALLFLSGLTGFVPAWVAGTGFGAFVVVMLLGVPAVRRIYNAHPSYFDVIMKRRRMLSDARAHAAHLEGQEGLIWQCARMAEFNVALRNNRFNRLLRLSEQRVLPRYLTRREHVRLYLIYLLEAEKAYGRVQAAFFDGNQQALDRGWKGVAAEPEPRT